MREWLSNLFTAVIGWFTGLGGVRAVIGFFKAIGPAVKKLCSFSSGIARQKAEASKIEAQGAADVAKVEAQGEMDVAKIKAQGAADVKKIQAQSIIEIGKMAESAGYRAKWRRGNAELIVSQAVNHMPSDNPHENAEKLRNLPPDWAVHAIEAAENTSEPYMQSLWAKILGGEAERSGSFSKHTVSIVKNMSQEDALRFTNFCQFVWSLVDNNEELIPLVYDSQGEVYQGQHRMFETAKHLDYLRLISFDVVAGYSKMPLAPPQSGRSHSLWRYHDDYVLLHIPRRQVRGGKSRHEVSVGCTLFTEAGRQLYHICEVQKNDAFFQYIMGKWRALGYNPVIQEKGAEE